MRELNATALALIDSIEAGQRVPLVQLVELGFDPVERYTSAGGKVTWDGHDWLPIAMRLEPVEDSVSEMSGVVLHLPAVDEAELGLVLGDDIEGVSITIYDCLLDPATGAVADAVSCWSGTLGAPTIEDGPANASVAIQCEHRGVAALRAKPVRYTDAEQRRIDAADTCLAFDPAVDAAPLVWPAASYWKR